MQICYKVLEGIDAGEYLFVPLRDWHANFTLVAMPTVPTGLAPTMPGSVNGNGNGTGVGMKTDSSESPPALASGMRPVSAPAPVPVPEKVLDLREGSGY
jgi:hypothetical protein